MATIDADAHVLEQPRTWAFMEEHEKQYTPMIVTPISGQDEFGPQGNVLKEYWVVDGRIHHKQSNMDLNTSVEAREFHGVKARLDHMDELEIDVQVLYPTLFLRPYTTNVDVEYAMCRSYNRWLAEIWKQAPDRFFWVVCPPLLSPIDRVRGELEFAKENGAVGIFMRPLECERTVTDTYFHPLYEIATELDLAICLHSGTNAAGIHELFKYDTGFNKFKLAMVGAFHMLVWEDTPSKFPKLRWAFIECSAEWIPYALNDLGLRYERRGKKIADNVMARNNIYVACQSTDDLAHILKSASEDHIVIGTDYGHHDTSAEIEAIRKIQDDGKLDARVVGKILDDNPRRLYGLS